ncbi:MAG: site-2 protease family protein [Acidimicrobiia bacterium]|nr:site-2 protease family protein [Acidimicrobiia bacterium]
MIFENDFLDAAAFIVLLIPSIIAHEVAHGTVALRLGDPTARDAGRLTLNPIPHIDPFGSVILPGLLALAGSTIFGWAKPVPVVPRYFRNPTEGMAITALAGPATNLVLAVITGRVVLEVLDLHGTALRAVFFFGLLNAVLAVFNLLPIPPLDGSRLLPLVLTPNGRRMYAQVEQYGFLILFALVFVWRDGLGRMMREPINLALRVAGL